MGSDVSDEPLATDSDENSESTPQLSPDQLQRLEYEVLRQQRLVLGATGGFIAACVGALIWACITYASGYEIGWIAVGIGFLVGITIWEGFKISVNDKAEMMAAVHQEDGGAI